jgi:hypothetical protein
MGVVSVDKPLYGQTGTAVQVKQYRELGQSGYKCRCRDESNEGEQSRIKDYGKQMALSPKA